MTGTDRFRTLRSVVELAVVLKGDGPMLIRGLEAGAADRPDLAFVRYPSPYGEVPFVPGSSLKGVLRSGTEAVLRGLGQTVCGAVGDGSCSASADVRRDPTRRCPACLMYGCTHGASVVLLDDAMPWRPDQDEEGRRARLQLIERRTSIRTSVAIQRQTGAASPGALFDYEVLVSPTFFTSLRLRNPEPWQVAALAAGLELLSSGVLRLGSGTSRGLGRVRADVTELSVSYLDQSSAALLLDTVDFGPVEGDGLLDRRRAVQPVLATTTLAGHLPNWLPA